MTLRTRLTSGLAGLVLFAIVSSGWALLTVARSRLEGAQATQARLVSEQILRILRGAYDPTLGLGNPVNRNSLGGTASALIERGDVREIVIVDDQKRPVVGKVQSDWGSGMDWEKYSAPQTNIVRKFPAIYVYAPLVGFEKQFVGWVRLQLAGDDAIASAMSQFWFLLAAIALLDGTFVVLFGMRFLRSVLEPVEALSRTSLQVAGGNLDVLPVVCPTTRDEVAGLVEAFNAMTSSLRTQQNHLLAQEKLATVGLLAAGVAHEIGNPLAVVTAYIDMLTQEDFHLNEAEEKDALQRMRKEAARIRNIVQELLDYSRPVADRLERVDVQELFEGALSLLRHQPRFRDRAVQVNWQGPVVYAQANPSRLMQVLVNLFLNAADAMQGQGNISITTSAPDPWIEIRVADSGPGIPVAVRERVFDPFFSTKEPGQGTGLGLAISRSIVQVYGGQLVVEPTTVGATFMIRLRAWTELQSIDS